MHALELGSPPQPGAIHLFVEPPTLAPCAASPLRCGSRRGAAECAAETALEWCLTTAARLHRAQCRLLQRGHGAGHVDLEPGAVEAHEQELGREGRD